MIALQEMPQIEGVAASVNSPYANSSWGGGMRLPGGRRIDYGMNRVTDDYPRTARDPRRRRTLVQP